MNEVIQRLLKPLTDELLKAYDENIVFAIRNNLIEYEVEEYNRNLYIKTLLHRTTPKRLLDIYQPLSVVKSFRSSRLISGIDDLFEKQFVTLVGGAGSGKSTLVKFLVLQCLDNSNALPLKVELRYLNDYEGNLEDYFKEHIFKSQGITDSDVIVNQILSSGKCVVFLDGYDELDSNNIQSRTKEIDQFVKRYNKNRYALTTRPFTSVELLPLFHNYTVADLSDEDIASFIKRQFEKSEEELASKIVEAIELKANSNYKSFVRNPLLLSMFILTFRSYADIPEKRSVFYKQVYDTLFSVHDSMSKLAFIREKRTGFSKERFEEFLSIFSFLSYFEEKFVFSKEYIENKFDLIKSKRGKFESDNEDILYDLTVSISIMSVEGTHFTFPHRSLQEYFAVNYLLELSLPSRNKVYKKMLSEFKNSFNQVGYRINTDAAVEKHDKASKFMERFNSMHQLLIEMDKFNFTKTVLLPVYDKIIKNLNSECQANKKYRESRIMFQLSISNMISKLPNSEAVRDFNHRYSNTTFKLHEEIVNEFKKETGRGVDQLSHKQFREEYTKRLPALTADLEGEFIPLRRVMLDEYIILRDKAKEYIEDYKETENDFSDLI